MILRRVIQHVRKQEWTAIWIDLVIVVAGVFLGIQVANWNEARQQAARQHSYMQRMRADFTGIRERIQEHFVVYRDTQQGGDMMLSLLRADGRSTDGGGPDAARMASAFNALVSTRIPPPLPSTYVEMQSEGQLSQISNPELRDRLAEYDRLLGIVQEVARINGDVVVAQAPVMQRHVVTRTVVDETALSGVRTELISYDLAAMRADRDVAVATALLQRYAVNSMIQRKRQLALIDRIIGLIDAETNR